VNLIGDHTDYNGLPVLPMAIQRELRIAWRRRTDRCVRLESAVYEPRSFELASSIEPYEPGDWGNYAKAAAKALCAAHPEIKGIDALVAGDVPEGAGLASSSAFVVAMALALLEANQIAWDPAELAEEMARAERYVGSNGGAMDQTVCLCAQNGTALKIDFTPFRLTPVPAPREWTFVVGNSMVVAEKAYGARERYNQTRARCAEALKGVSTMASYSDLLARNPLSDLLAIAKARLTPDLARTFKHVVSEGLRVKAAETAMRAGDVHAFGRLMNESHESLRNDLNVSCPELNELAAAFKTAGAAGARMTGAGFGGCVVAVCDRSRVVRMLQVVRETFYQPRRVNAAPHLFVAEARGAAGVLPPNSWDA
jgi:galactokinase